MNTNTLGEKTKTGRCFRIILNHCNISTGVIEFNLPTLKSIIQDTNWVKDVVIRNISKLIKNKHLIKIGKNRYYIPFIERHVDLDIEIRKMPKGKDNKRSKPIYQLTTDGELVREYACYKEVEDAGFNRGNVSRAISGSLATSNGYVWKHKDNYNEPVQLNLFGE